MIKEGTVPEASEVQEESNYNDSITLTEMIERGVSLGNNDSSFKSRIAL